MLSGFTPCHLLCRHGMATQMCGIIGLFTHEVRSEPQRLSEAPWSSHTAVRPTSAMSQTCAWFTSVSVLECPSPESEVSLTAVKTSGPFFTLCPL